MTARTNPAWPRILLATYLIVLLALTLLPDAGSNPARGVDVHLKAFSTIGLALRRGLGSHEMALLIGNVLAFVPLGVLLPLVLRRRSLLIVLAAALVLSTTIETGQYLLSAAVGYDYRTPDVDDVIVNVFGATLGYAMFLLFAALAETRDSPSG